VDIVRGVVQGLTAPWLGLRRDTQMEDFPSSIATDRNGMFAVKIYFLKFQT